MNILPKKYTQFKQKAYWDNFYKSLKNTQHQFFQWYGSYSDYSTLLSQLILPSSNIFHVGCGTSIFCQDLLQNIPSLHIINCDYSQNVINQMKQRSSKLNLNMEYKVIDLLQPISQQYHNKFHVILDKGTLDAMLPDDSLQNINKIKNIYFNNMVKCLRQNNTQHPQFIIISLLQPFVLKTVIEYFGFQPQQYSVNIYQCLINNSKLQPFLISITLNHNLKQQKILKFHRLGKLPTQICTTFQQISQKITKIQQQVNYSHQIKQLQPERRTKFNIYQQNNKSNIRYIIQVIDSQNKQILTKNTCSIFIVPQGKQNTYLFNTDQGIKQLHLQINSSRLIIIKLVTGNLFGNIDQVKQQINSIIPEFIQHNWDITKTPYLTDADQLGHCYSLFQNQEIVIDQVLIEQQPIRRLFLKTNPTIPQCQFQLTYLSQSKNKHLQQLNSKILPFKKNMVIGIDKIQLFDDNSRSIYSGITALYGSPKTGWKVLIVGCQLALAKFLYHTFQKVEITVLCGDYKSIVQVVSKYLQLQQSQRFQLLPCTLPTYFTSFPQKQFNIIMVCNNVQNDKIQNPCSITYNQQQQIIKHIQYPGIFIYQYWNHIIVPNLSALFFPIYHFQHFCQTDNILFALQFHKNYQENNKVILHQNLINIVPKSKAQYDWQVDNWKNLAIIQPAIKKNGKQFIYNHNYIHVEKQLKFLDVYQNQTNNDDNKTKKKKKKKK